MFCRKTKSEECRESVYGNEYGDENKFSSEDIKNFEQREKTIKRIFNRYQDLVIYYRRQYTNE